LIRALRAAFTLAALLPVLACGSSSETFVATSPTRCAVQTDANPTAFAPDGGAGTVRISTNRDCSWSVRSDAAWIGVPAQASGNGEATLQFTVSANSEPSTRTANLNVNDRLVEISQQGRPCRFEVSSNRVEVDAAGGQRTVHVQSSGGQCPWTATTDAAWIRVVRGDSATGAGDVVLDVEPTTGPSRTATLTIAGQHVDIVQGLGCSVATAVTTLTVGSAGGGGDVAVLAGPACTWTARSNVSWVTIVSGESGSGQGVVRISVLPSDGPPRSGTITVAGVTITVTQSSGCSISVAPATYAAPAAGGSVAVTVRAATGCAWSATSSAAWIAITSGGSGNGDGQVQIAVAANPGPARSASATIGSHAVSISQAAGCTFTIAPAAVDLASVSQAMTISVGTNAGCQWTASSQAAWITPPQTSGAGPAQVPFTVAANNGPPRSASVTVAGQTVAVTQASPCSWSVAPPAHDFGADGGLGNVLVIVTGACTWTAASTVGWITVEAGSSGVGNGLLQFIVAANAGAARTGIVKIADIDYLVRQAGR
jgi:hypothetical protein